MHPEQAPSNDGAEHASLHWLNIKEADTILSEADRLYKEAKILEDHLDEAIKQRKALLDRKEKHQDELNTFSRRSKYRREVQKRYFLTENEVCCLQKAYDSKEEYSKQKNLTEYMQSMKL